jgi:hypothetical protein
MIESSLRKYQNIRVVDLIKSSEAASTEVFQKTNKNGKLWWWIN